MPEDVAFLERQIVAFNPERTGIRDGSLLASFVRDDGNAIVAGLYGWTWGGTCEIRYLWVDERLRGQGHGRRLLAAAEGEALRRGCSQVILATHSFQAPGFYRKLGYATLAVIDDYPRGHQQLLMRKALSGP